MSVSLPDRIEPVLARMLGSLTSVETLTTGTTGTSFVVGTAAGRFVAKAFLPDSQVLLGPAEQFALLTTLDESGIAPTAIGYDDKVGLLVTEFIEPAAPVSRDHLLREETIELVAAGLKALHAVAADIPAFAPVAHVSGYIERLGGRTALSDRDRRRHDELIELAGGLDSLPVCLCHNDLVVDNMLFDPALHLIDFDYAAIAPAVVDLASLTTLNGFSEEQTTVLLDAYFGNRGRFPGLKFARVERLMRLVAHFWSLASADTDAALVRKHRIEDD